MVATGVGPGVGAGTADVDCGCAGVDDVDEDDTVDVVEVGGGRGWGADAGTGPGAVKVEDATGGVVMVVTEAAGGNGCEGPSYCGNCSRCSGAAPSSSVGFLE